MKFFTACALGFGLACLLIASCTPAQGVPSTTAKAQIIDNGTEIREYVFPDGLRCAVFQGYNRGGIACN